MYDIADTAEGMHSTSVYRLHSELNLLRYRSTTMCHLVRRAVGQIAVETSRGTLLAVWFFRRGSLDV